MSNSNPPDPTRNHPDKIASNNKVIVLSMKNMSSFKFDPSKNFLGNTAADNGQSVFNFKPQQLVQPQASTAQQVQVLQASPVAVQKIGPPGTILIRAQSTGSSSKPHLAALSTSSNIKIHESIGKSQVNVNKETIPPTITTFRSRSTSEITMKTQTGHTLLIQPSIVKSPKIITAQSPIAGGLKGITLATAAPASALSQFQITNVPKLTGIQKNVAYPSSFTIKSPSSSKLVPIRPKVDPEKDDLIKQQRMPNNRSKISQTSVQTLVTAKINRNPQNFVIPRTAMAPVPALTLIQPKPTKVEIIQDVSLPEVTSVTEEPAEEEDLEVLEVKETTPEKPKRTPQEELYMQVKRIIEGDQDDIEQHTVISQVTSSQPEPEDEHFIEEDSQEQLMSSQEPDSSSSILLCDEKIENVSSTEVSPVDNEMSKDVTATPEQADEAELAINPSVLEVRKNLSEELALECDKENVGVVLEEESRSDDDYSLTESQRQLLQDYDETLMKSEILKSDASHSTPAMSIAQGKAKRTRKPKNPTIISTLGLPYKPPQPSTRKSKVEKKLEFELDFHDPLNKIQWDDGIGGLNNCNKLFGFDEFGLIEVLSKKDAMAKLNQMDVKEIPRGRDEGTSFKLRKISDPIDQFVCVVCAKMGTIRDFYSPEACSESCLAITKRKASDSNTSVKESSSESGLTTPIDERKLMFGGELVPIQQLQQHLLEQHLPKSKRRQKKHSGVTAAIEEKFQWDTYLTEKSVPASLELFKNPYPRSQNPFKVGMKLEAIDPANQKLFCVCTVEEKLGYRIKLHFDGYPKAYDFWANADSRNIFPAGFCHSTNRALQTHPKWSQQRFDWSEYLDYSNSIGAARALFPRYKEVVKENPFEVGMKLETSCEGKIYAASILDVVEDRVLVSHDGHEELGCVWLDIHSPYLHPINYHKTTADPESFIPPYRPFSWVEYLKTTNCKAAPTTFFYHTRSPFDFEPGLKLEVTDCVNQQLIRPATVLRRDDYKIQVIFDGFDIKFAYWLDDDSEDIHPINWCEKTNHPIEHPAGFNKSFDNGLCTRAGCRGIGNGLHSDRFFHDNAQECPYNQTNWTKLLNFKLGSHIDAKQPTKKLAKQLKSTLTKEPARNSSSRSSYPRDSANFKEETKDDDISMDIDFDDDDVVERITKRNKRKRKAPTPAAEETQEEINKKIKVSKEFLEDYGPQLNYSYKLWTKNSKVLDRATIEDISTKNPMEWSVEDVSSFIKKIDSDDELASKFQEQAIDGSAFLSMNKNDLMDLMNIKLGVAVKICNRILHLRQEVVLKFINIM